MRLSCDPNEILWYAMSSPFRREMKAKALLDAHHIENFIPMKKRQEIRDGEIVTWEEPAIHNFVFVHDSYNGIMKVKKGLDILQFILNPLSPIVVPQRQMDDFIRLYESDGYDEPEFLTPQTMGQHSEECKGGHRRWPTCWHLWLLPASEGGEGQALHSVDRGLDSNGMQRGV